MEVERASSMSFAKRTGQELAHKFCCALLTKVQRCVTLRECGKDIVVNNSFVKVCHRSQQRGKFDVQETFELDDATEISLLVALHKELVVVGKHLGEYHNYDKSLELLTFFVSIFISNMIFFDITQTNLLANAVTGVFLLVSQILIAVSLLFLFSIILRSNPVRVESGIVTTNIARILDTANKFQIAFAFAFSSFAFVFPFSVYEILVEEFFAFNNNFSKSSSRLSTVDVYLLAFFAFIAFTLILLLVEYVMSNKTRREVRYLEDFYDKLNLGRGYVFKLSEELNLCCEDNDSADYLVNADSCRISIEYRFTNRLKDSMVMIADYDENRVDRKVQSLLSEIFLQPTAAIAVGQGVGSDGVDRRKSVKLTSISIMAYEKALLEKLFRCLSNIKLAEMEVRNLKSRERLKILKGHTGPVYSTDIYGDSCFVSASYDKTLKLWHDGECTKTFYGHSASVNCVAFLSHGKEVISGSHDKTIRLWDIHSGKCKFALVGHSGPVLSIAVLSTGDMISASEDGTLKLWNLASKVCKQIYSGHTGPVYAVTVVHGANPEDFVVSGSGDTTLKVWTLHHATCSGTLRGHNGPVLSVAAVASTSSIVVSGSMDMTIKAWDYIAMECKWTFAGHSGPVYSVSLTKEANEKCVIVSASHDKTLNILHWSLDSPNPDNEGEFKRYAGPVYNVEVKGEKPGDRVIIA